MIWLALLLAAGPDLTQQELDATFEASPNIGGIPKEWLARRAPFGWDFTPDGKIWINQNQTGTADDYAMLATDMLKATGRHRRAWVRGYHKRNPTVRYRTSMMLVAVDCEQRTLSLVQTQYNDASGNMVSRSGPSQQEYVAPGTYGETWLENLCL